jgi:hypothetical protein
VPFLRTFPAPRNINTPGTRSLNSEKVLAGAGDVVDQGTLPTENVYRRPRASAVIAGSLINGMFSWVMSISQVQRCVRQTCSAYAYEPLGRLLDAVGTTLVEKPDGAFQFATLSGMMLLLVDPPAILPNMMTVDFSC